jgi:amidase
VGEHPLDALDLRLELARRPHAQSLRARSQHERLELGHGAAIAASLAAVGVGTETDGSIISPATRTASSASSRPWGS